MHADYERLCTHLLTLAHGEDLPWPFDWSDDRVEEEVAVLVLKATGLTAAYWKRLSHEGRVPWLLEAIGQEEARTVAGSAIVVSGQPDSGADNGKKNPMPLPENPDVVELARRVSQARGTSGTHGVRKVDLARELCEGDEERAQSLLRQLRRFPRLLRE